MKIAVQTTNYPEVVDKINVLLNSLTYADPSSSAAQEILRDCERVRRNEPAFGWSLLSLYYSVIGESQEADRCFRTSQAWENLFVASENYHASLSNTGFFSKAHSFFKERGSPETGMFSALANNALMSGSIQTFVLYFDMAVAMQMEMPTFQIESARIAADLLRRTGVTDEHLTRHLDAAGAVLRRHRLFFQEVAELEISDEPDVLIGVTYVFRIKMSPPEVFEMNLELALTEEEMGIEKSSSFDVVFLPA
jgi:hypothetical protein